MTNAALLFFALLLDAIFGEPKALWDRVPHPAVLMGRLIEWIERRFNTGNDRKAKGIVAMVFLGAGALISGALLAELPFGDGVSLLCAAVLLAQRSLVDHVRAVASALRLSTSGGRIAVAKIVGRDTKNMDDTRISRAAIESAAENLSDGVVAPAFWFLLLGLPGLLLYKITNTADSMIGYKTPRYQEFGWAAARFDDLLNFVPARLTALLILAVRRTLQRWHTVREDAPMHRSPNAGWPEAAMAASLGIALSGPRSYDGEMRNFPYVNSGGRRDIGPSVIDASVSVLWQVWAACLAISAVLALI
ncbi:adenosylcobinamide-phosphate synthase CbiB [Falsihalocynthiibacter sp. SS001]|uniref:adenosylcobinamide-phosphate synthase CbiB n=1 Tax=Falsihalocynthiibacter sp. SS001 TaxID=3349698 RepID=UPI0036D2A926